MLDSGSAFGDDTLTIWKSTLDNPESGGRKYPAAHLSKNMAILSFFDSGHFEVISRPLKAKFDREFRSLGLFFRGPYNMVHIIAQRLGPKLGPPTISWVTISRSDVSRFESNWPVTFTSALWAEKFQRNWPKKKMFSKFRNSKTHTGNNSAHPKFSEYRQKEQNYGYRQTNSSRQPTQQSINSQMVSHLTGRRAFVFRNTFLAIAKSIFAAHGSKLSNEESKSATSQSNSSTNGLLFFFIQFMIYHFSPNGKTLKMQVKVR